MKLIIRCAIFLLVTSNIFQANGQALPAHIKQVIAYVRPVYSQGAKLEEISIDGTVKQMNKKSPSFQYFLYLQTDCKNIRVSSVTIDQVKYQFEVKKVASPVMISGSQPKQKELVKKSKYKVFQIADLSTGVEEDDDRVVNHKIVIKGTVNGKAFTVRPAVKQLSPLVAQ